MARVVFEGVGYACDPAETVLDCLSRHGVATPSSCRSGICQTCMLRAVEGFVPAAAQKGLKETLQQQNFFLACACVPESDLSVALPDAQAAPKITARVVEKSQLSPIITRVRLDVADGFAYRPGQFINLARADGLVRSYSLASVPELENFVELHVQSLANGAMSNWVRDGLSYGDSVTLSEPLGGCFYVKGKLEQPLLLVGTGSGLAPLYAVARDALAQGHRGAIWLYHGSSRPDGLYLADELRVLSAKFPNLQYVPCVSRGEPLARIAHGRASDIALREHPDLKGWRVFLCGHAEMVQGAKMAVFMAGASMREIHADAFVHAAAA